MSDYKQTNDEVIERLRDWPFMGKAMAKATADHIEQLAAINEALISERDEAWKRAGHAEMMWGKAEVKLAKAVELALEECPFREGTVDYDYWWHDYRTTLAELTGGKNG